ncbi:MAG: FAD binding domain-containing protein [Thermodesulfobacteriota bacterium]
MSRFVTARSLDGALDEVSHGARIIAGGTDFMIHVRRERLFGDEPSHAFVDVSRLEELNRLDLSSDLPFVGAAVTFRRLETSPEVRSLYGALAQCAATVGSVQIRTLATIGGNAANASPAADGVTALVALGARAKIVSPEGTRTERLEELITGPNRTNLSPEEIIVGFELDRSVRGTAQVFRKIGRRQAVVIARLNVAVCLGRDLSDPRVVVGSCFPSPRRLSAVEALLASGSPGPTLWKEAGLVASKEFVMVCGWRASASYKTPVTAALVTHALESAWEQVEVPDDHR